MNNPTSADFNLDKFDKQRRSILTRLIGNPRFFSKNIYKTERKKKFSKKILKTDFHDTVEDIELCCLISKFLIATQTEEEILNSTCLFSEISINEDLNEDLKRSGLSHVKLYNVRAKNNYLLRTYPNIKVKTNFSLNPPTNLTSVTSVKLSLADSSNISKRNIFDKCLYPDYKRMVYFGSDPFTNDYLIGFTLRMIYKSSERKGIKLNGYVKYHGATVCLKRSSTSMTLSDAEAEVVGRSSNGLKYNNTGTILTEKLSSDNLSDYIKIKSNAIVRTDDTSINVLPKKIVIDIFKQIIANLAFLQTNLAFIHGNMTTDSIFISDEISNISYNKMKHKSVITLKIGNYESSSLIALSKKGYFAPGEKKDILRIFRSDSLANKYLKIKPFKPEIDEYFGQPIYVINDTFNAQTYAKLRNMGFPYYLSIDTYFFIISMFLHKEVFYTVFFDEELSLFLFDSLFFQDDKTKVFRRIEKIVNSSSKNKHDISNILKVLKGIKLRCLATERLFFLVKKL